MANIHPSAVIADGAKLGANITIGPFCHIGPEVTLGDGCVLHSHVVIVGNTTIGQQCTFYPTAVIGCLPQNNAHKGGHSALTIGDHCTFREGVTVHLGTDTSRALTSIGNHGMFLANSHIAHDCAVGDHVTFANGVLLGGHVEIGDRVILGGGTAVHQFVRVGHHAFAGGLSGLQADLIPFGMAIGNRSRLGGLNLVGLKRSGLPRSDIHALRGVYKTLFDKSKGTLRDNALALKASNDVALVDDILDFILSDAKRSFIIPVPKGERSENA